MSEHWACGWWRPRRTKARRCDQAKLAGPLAIFIGSEGAGVPRDLIKDMDEVVAIPHAPQVESLNAGVAASIVLYEVARQKALTMKDTKVATKRKSIRCGFWIPS